ncbi:MAG: hypothetical protein R2710_21280 [Acidimicrobiales bacterium]
MRILGWSSACSVRRCSMSSGSTRCPARRIDGGSTLAEAAAAQGVGADELAAALTAAAEERLADAVADGKIDAEKAAEIQARIAEQVQAHLDGPPPGD